ncbi:RNA-directed DNA polymerase-like protein [Labeo rohita]|uniref:RNA-directed DNA polymerase-like protein n=1 Tax=Labeo rohita TaxID=84645 RepID=A0A498N9C2_LABRO|nr:RNA-directed DNA polymerase-like protein [Labeo rohita]
MERKTVRECPDQSGSDEESSVPSNHEWRQKNSEAEFKHRLQKFNKRNKVNWEEIVCHNCQGISHMRRNCPSPRLNLEHVTPALPRLYNPGTVAVKVRKGVIARIVMVRKKEHRLCVDFRALNEHIIKDAYPLSRIRDTLDTLSTAKWFSTLDLASGY